jgi:hypothetical protein
MNIRSLFSASKDAAGVDAMASAVNSAASAVNSATSAVNSAVSSAMTLMTCDDCELTGGPFEAAEAAHLRAIHDRLFHGVSSAA